MAGGIESQKASAESRQSEIVVSGWPTPLGARKQASPCMEKP